MDDRGHEFISHGNMPKKFSKDGSSNKEKNEESNSSLCNACIQPISPPFFSCEDTKCNFLLHQKCFELPFYVHSGNKRLSFRGLNLEDFFGIFHCDACHRPCNGYYFQRAKGNRVLDAKCALSPEFIIHESHPQHRLLLDKRRYGPCPCCLLAGEDQGEYIYRCETCSFNLHQKCALYPSTVRHRYDKHPLKLTYKPIRVRLSDECYCEICELELNHRGWFYYCVECDQSFHVTCIPALDHLSNIKFGGTLTLNFHPHPLTFDRIILERSCQDCNKIIEDGMAFQCKECTRYQIHFECAKSRSRARGQDMEECIFASWDTGNPYSTEG